MSEAWREVARLGKKGEKYPHILVDSHGWCLRLGPQDREDEKYYSSILTPLQGLSEHLQRQKDHGSVTTVAEIKDLVAQNLKEARELGAELERKFADLRQRLLEGRDKARLPREAGTPGTAPVIAAGVPAVESEAA